MLEYAVSGRRLTVEDIAFQQYGALPAGASRPPDRRDSARTWRQERALAQMVREGNLDYADLLNETMRDLAAVPLFNDDQLTQMRVLKISFIAHITHAAIEGGLSPDRAYTESDACLQRIVYASTIAEITNLGLKLYRAFVQEVHDCNANPALGREIQSCCDYIAEHLEEKLTIHLLAERLGYSDYYLSKKFKIETGVSVNSYIKMARIERAKLLLSTTTRSIQEISDALRFGNRSFFDDAFKQVTGTTPAAYRRQHQRL